MPNRLLERFDKYNQKNKIEVTIRKRGKLGYIITVGKDVGFYIGMSGSALTLNGAKREAKGMVEELEKEIIKSRKQLSGEDVVCRYEK